MVEVEEDDEVCSNLGYYLNFITYTWSWGRNYNTYVCRT